MGIDPSEGLWTPPLEVLRRRLARCLLGMGVEMYPAPPLVQRTEK